MPIVYIHGVATRSEHKLYEAERDRRVAFLRRYVASAIADDPENVLISPVYWGDLGATFAFNHKSRPDSWLLHQGGGDDMNPYERAASAAALHDTLVDLPEDAPASPPPPNGLIASGSSDEESSAARLFELNSDQLSDLLVEIGRKAAGNDGDPLLIALAADAVATNPATQSALEDCPTPEEEQELLVELLLDSYDEELRRAGKPLPQGGPSWAERMGDRVSEAMRRADNIERFVVTRAAVEAFRKPLNTALSVFIGDVFAYLDRRVARDASGREIPGPIPLRLLDALAAAHDDKLRRGGEPLIVLSHSMGGQIVYDAVTSFLPTLPQYQHIRVDFWAAAASQVGLFEEMRLFRVRNNLYSAATHTLVPFPNPPYLGTWWNVWDHNDVLSFTVNGIFHTRPETPTGVDDEPYNSGMDIGGAHGGYLEQPSFYRKFAAKLRAAKLDKESRRA